MRVPPASVLASKYEASTSDAKVVQAWNVVIANALAQLEYQASQLGADGVVGVQLTTSETGCYLHAAVMGSAIKFR